MGENEQIAQVRPFSISSLSIKQDYQQDLSAIKIFAQLIADEEVEGERPKVGQVMCIW